MTRNIVKEKNGKRSLLTTGLIITILGFSGYSIALDTDTDGIDDNIDTDDDGDGISDSLE